MLRRAYARAPHPTDNISAKLPTLPTAHISPVFAFRLRSGCLPFRKPQIGRSSSSSRKRAKPDRPRADPRPIARPDHRHRDRAASPAPCPRRRRSRTPERVSLSPSQRIPSLRTLAKPLSSSASANPFGLHSFSPAALHQAVNTPCSSDDLTRLLSSSSVHSRRKRASGIALVAIVGRRQRHALGLGEAVLEIIDQALDQAREHARRARPP
jgi:hypothetical protein